MSIIERSISYETQAMTAWPAADHDDGLAHCHDWAKDRVAAEGSHPMVADAGCVPTPSCVRHDDAYVIG